MSRQEQSNPLERNNRSEYFDIRLLIAGCVLLLLYGVSVGIFGFTF
jgi:hypothetical protein